jgi:DNA-directed RNA polymerase specialized sigma subunit
MSHRAIADRFGISHSHVSKIISKDAWGWLWR